MRRGLGKGKAPPEACSRNSPDMHVDVAAKTYRRGYVSRRPDQIAQRCL